MKTLLKDMPEFAERIEGNMPLESEIKSILEYNSDWSDSSQCMILKDFEFLGTSTEIIQKLTDFVNQNYTWKGIAK